MTYRAGFLLIALLFGMSAWTGCSQPSYEKEVIEETLEYPKADNYASEVSDVPGRNGINQDVTEVDDPVQEEEIKPALDSIYHFGDEAPMPVVTPEKTGKKKS